jgi:hypothetical protein
VFSGCSKDDVGQPPRKHKCARYQWFWAGSQEESKKLTPDLKHTVKRHVVVTRIVPAEGFPFDNAQNKTDEEEGTPQAPSTGASKRVGNEMDGKNKEGGSQVTSTIVGRVGNEMGAASTDLGRAKEGAPQTLSAGGRGNSNLKSSEHLLMALKRCFEFHFCIQVR